MSQLQNPDLSPDQYYASSTMEQLSGTRNGKSQMTPRQQNMSSSRMPGAGSVPRLQKIKSVQELQPRINSQPPFRRANPEGGFISVRETVTFAVCITDMCYAAASSLNNTSTLNISNMQSDLQIRIVTKPTQSPHKTKQGCEEWWLWQWWQWLHTVREWYTWQWRDRTQVSISQGIILPILISDRNRYLILDVLGQGTFGQVVKCQNLKTQEVVAVKVVKNRTAYFNQSMMEVSVLDLVGFQLSYSERNLTRYSLTRSSTRMMITTFCASRIHLSINNICALFSSFSASIFMNSSNKINFEVSALLLFEFLHSSYSMDWPCWIRLVWYIVIWNQRTSSWRSKSDSSSRK